MGGAARHGRLVTRALEEGYQRAAAPLLISIHQQRVLAADLLLCLIFDVRDRRPIDVSE